MWCIFYDHTTASRPRVKTPQVRCLAGLQEESRRRPSSVRPHCFFFLLVYNPARQPTRRAASQHSPLRRTFAGRLASSSHRTTLIEKLRVRRHHVSRASGERQHPVDWGATLWGTLGYRNARTSHRSDTTERTDWSGGHARCWSPMGEARRSAAMITLEA